MKKKTVRYIIIGLISAAVLFVIFDFVKDMSSEQEAREEASQEETITDEGTDESEEVDEDTDFDFSDDLEEEETTEAENDANNEEDAEDTYGAYPGQKAYDFELTEIGSDEVVKLSDYRGQKVFLNFWASWCPPCKIEAPHLQKFAESQDDVVVLGVNVTVSESNLDNIQEFIDEYGFTFTNVYGVEEMFGLFFVESLPTSLFIDSEGVIQERVVGPVTEDVLEANFSMID